MDLETSFQDRTSPKKKAKHANRQFVKKKKKKTSIDFFSKLPDELIITILSFLLPHIAARTSVLCQRFRHLWEASPSLELNILFFNFIVMANHALLRRNPSYPLLSLQLRFDNRGFPDSYIPSLLAKAGSLGLQHLTVEAPDLVPILPSIFSISSLRSLSLYFMKLHEKFPSGFTLTCLTSLSVLLYEFCSTDNLNQLLSELHSLQDLKLNIQYMKRLSLSSQTIRNLKLIIYAAHSEFNTLELFLPSLESIHLENLSLLPSLFHIHGEVPMLKRAVIILDVKMHSVMSIDCREDIRAVKRLLKFISHVEELSLHVKDMETPIPILLDPVKDFKACLFCKREEKERMENKAAA